MHEGPGGLRREEGVGQGRHEPGIGEPGEGRERDSDGDGGTQILFGGDLGRYNRPVLPDPSAVDTADVLLLESTYGDRAHDPDDNGDRLATVIRETYQLITKSFDKMIEIRMSVPESLPVTGDPSGLTQVLMNLCTNARDAMPRRMTPTLLRLFRMSQAATARPTAVDVKLLLNE